MSSITPSDRAQMIKPFRVMEILREAKEFEEKVENLKSPGIYLTIEDTQRKGSKILRLKTSEEYGNLNRSFPPNDNSIKIIKKLINEQKK